MFIFKFASKAISICHLVKIDLKLLYVKMAANIEASYRYRQASELKCCSNNRRFIYLVHGVAARRRQLRNWPPFSLPDIVSLLQR
jgi:hypothetical protein